MVYSFYFLFVGFTWMNSIVFGGEKGTRSEDRGLFWYCLRDAVTDNKMIPQALSLHMMNLSLSCRKISFFSERMSYVIYNAHLAARMPRRSWIRMYDKYKSDFFTFLENDNPLYFYCLLKRVPNLLDDTSSEQAVDFWPIPFISPKTIEFIPSGAKTQKKEIIPYPRCGFGACLRCEWAF